MGAVLLRQDGRPVCERCLLAETPLTRLQGSLGAKGSSRAKDFSFALPRPSTRSSCASRSTPVWVDRDLNVLKVSPDLGPWRTAACKGAKGVVEMAAGEAERVGISAGDKLTLA